jgi:hypothetical protein
MTDRTIYQWDVETIDADGDIVGHEQGTLKSLLDVFGSEILTGTASQRLVLIRDRYNDVEGVTDRQWAYIEAGALPAEFDGGSAVPARFQKELSRT